MNRLFVWLLLKWFRFPMIAMQINPMNFQRIPQKRVIKPNLNEFWNEYMSIVTIHHKHVIRCVNLNRWKPRNYHYQIDTIHTHTLTRFICKCTGIGRRWHAWRKDYCICVKAKKILKKKTRVTSFYLTNKKKFIVNIWAAAHF